MKAAIRLNTVSLFLQLLIWDS